MKSVRILSKFLEENGLNPDYIRLIRERIQRIEEYFSEARNDYSEDYAEVDTSIVYQIITDMYDLNKEAVKHIATVVREQLKIAFGHQERELIKEILDYDSADAIERLKILCPDAADSILQIVRLNKVNHKEKVRELFLQSFEMANTKKKAEQLYSLFLRLYHMNELKQVRLYDLFMYNLKILRKELKPKELARLEQFCTNDTSTYDVSTGAKKFYAEYLSILKSQIQEQAEQNKMNSYLNHHYYDTWLQDEKYVFDRHKDIMLFKTEDFDLLFLNIDQEVYNTFADDKQFYTYVLTYVREAYRVLSNYKAFVVRVGNVYNKQGKNLKWDIYSRLIIFAEHFVPTRLDGSYYHPERIASELLGIFGIDLDESELKLLRNYYRRSISFDELVSKSRFAEFYRSHKTLIGTFEFAPLGFTFDDCFVLRRERHFYNPQLPVIKNVTELLLVFYKYRVDNRRIPCPECGGLKVSGNSFPEIGHRSWECKNEICPSRSKSNRGKRYSVKSVFMQWGLEDTSEYNVIPREVVKKWRRDVVEIYSEKDIYEMVLRYYSFPGEKVLFINTDHLDEADELRRRVVYLSRKKVDAYVSTVSIPQEDGDDAESWFKKNIILSAITGTKNETEEPDLHSFITNYHSRAKFIRGDAYKVLQRIPENSIAAIITSPPYFNAREYSQWKNLYLYLFDMYKVIEQCFRVLRPGGVFLYNIGDIFDNERTVVTSKMGEKRIPLGAYSIYLFERAGFELLDNIIWDKGETQSHRHKNDGKFTPHYQKPANVYEHMLLFKKPGAELTICEQVEDTWKENVARFHPVIKINSKGENLYGHSAPFPEEIPYFVLKMFTTSDSDILLDPFSGSGTTVIVAAENQRIGVGIEINEEYFQLSIKRAQKLGLRFDALKY